MITIGLVDDHQLFLDGMHSVLSSEQDFAVLFAVNSAKTAFEKLKELQPDVIISDISMPEINGIEFIKIVRQQYPEIKIIVLSMFENLQSYDNIEGYLLKETDRQELIQTIRKIVINGEKVFKTFNKQQDIFEFKNAILTEREKQIIQLIAEEFTTEEIAEKLFVSKGTIETHRKNIFFKLQVKNIAGLIKKAVYLGIVK